MDHHHFEDETSYQDPSHRDDDAGKEVIAGRESRMVNWSKIVVVLVIAVFGVACGVLTYTFLKGQEKSAYKAHVSRSHLA